MPALHPPACDACHAAALGSMDRAARAPPPCGPRCSTGPSQDACVMPALQPPAWDACRAAALGPMDRAARAPPPCRPR